MIKVTRRIWILGICLICSPLCVALAAGSWSVGTASDAGDGYRAAFGRLNETVVGRYKYQASSSKLLLMGPDSAYLIVSGANIDESHAASGTLAVAQLQSANEKLTLRRRWLEVGGGSTWGGAPEFSVSSKIGPNPVIYTEGGGTWQGCTSSSAELIELTKLGPVSVAQFPVFYGPTKGAEISGKITNIRQGLSFDVSYTGAKRFVDRYVKKGTKYVLVSGQTKAETC
jgi:hypothetical protein